MSEHRACRNGINCHYFKRGKCKYFHPNVTILKKISIKPEIKEAKTRCKVCDQMTVVDRYSQDICKSCEEIRNIIFKEDDEQDERFYKSVVLLVTYNWSGSEHSGYCSDAGDRRETKGTETLRLPLLKIFGNNDFDDGGNIKDTIETKDKLKYYEKFQTFSYCGRQRHTIVSVLVKKRAREIDLDVTD